MSVRSRSDSEVSREKYFLRKVHKEMIDQMSSQERRRQSLDISVRLVKLPLFHKSQRVALYLSLVHEVDTDPIIRICRERRKEIYAPVVASSGQLEFYSLSMNTKDLKRNKYGIKEPDPKKSQKMGPKNIDLIIIPGRAFTLKGHRLGVGGGYYDRLLSKKFMAKKTIGLAYQNQIVSSLPQAPHDQRVSWVVTSL